MCDHVISLQGEQESALKGQAQSSSYQAGLTGPKEAKPPDPVRLFLRGLEAPLALASPRVEVDALLRVAEGPPSFPAASLSLFLPFLKGQGFRRRWRSTSLWEQGTAKLWFLQNPVRLEHLLCAGHVLERKQVSLRFLNPSKLLPADLSLKLTLNALTEEDQIESCTYGECQVQEKWKGWKIKWGYMSSWTEEKGVWDFHGKAIHRRWKGVNVW